jgi:hypothetical protein
MTRYGIFLLQCCINNIPMITVPAQWDPRPNAKPHWGARPSGPAAYEVSR